MFEFVAWLFVAVIFGIPALFVLAAITFFAWIVLTAIFD